MSLTRHPASSEYGKLSGSAVDAIMNSLTLPGQTLGYQTVLNWQPLTFTAGVAPLDASLGNAWVGSISAASSISIPTNYPAGNKVQVLAIRVKNTDASDRVLSFTTGTNGFRANADVNSGSLDFTITAGSTLTTLFVWNSVDSKWDAQGPTTGSGGGGSGTVTSVAAAGPTGVLTWSSAVTTSGTLTATLASQNANIVLAGPTSGGAATPAFRALVLGDLPSGVGLTASGLNQFASTTSSQLAGVISDETGTGALVFANTPTLVTPVLGAATGTSVVLTGKIQTTGGAVLGAVVSVTDGSTLATDASLGNHFRTTLAGATRTLGNPTNGTDGQRIVWELIQDGSGSRGTTFNLDTKWALGTDISSIVLTTTADKRDFLTAIYNSTADKWYIVGFVKGY
jgi:hypothetical protein